MKSQLRSELSEGKRQFFGFLNPNCNLSFLYVNPRIEKHRFSPDDNGHAPTYEDASKTSSLSNPIFSPAVHQAWAETLL